MKGRGLLALARAWLDEGVVHLLLEPLVADWQRECSSLTGGRLAWCRVQGTAAFARSFISALVRDIARPVPGRGSALGTFAVFAALGTVTLMLTSGPRITTASSAVLLIPGALSLALPFALVPVAVLLASNDRWRPHEARRVIVQIALATAIALVVLVGWITPLSNDTWRHETWSRIRGGTAVSGPRRGLRELTLTELASSTPPPNSLEPGFGTIAREWHTRWVVITTPFILIPIGLAAARIGGSASHAPSAGGSAPRPCGSSAGWWRSQPCQSSACLR